MVSSIYNNFPYNTEGHVFLVKYNAILYAGVGVGFSRKFVGGWGQRLSNLHQMVKFERVAF